MGLQGDKWYSNTGTNELCLQEKWIRNNRGQFLYKFNFWVFSFSFSFFFFRFQIAKKK